MDVGVVKRLFPAFFVGGLFGLVSQAFYEFWAFVLGPGSSWSMTLALLTLGVCGMILYIFGIYQKWEEKTAMGAVMPFSGLVSACASSYVKGYKEGGAGKAVWEGFKFFLYVLMVGSFLALIIGLILVFAF